MKKGIFVVFAVSFFLIFFTINKSVLAATASSQSVSTNEDTSKSITLTGSGTKETLTYTISTPPSHGSGTFTSNRSVRYTPTANYSGSDSFYFTVSGSRTGTSQPAKVSITVNAVNDPPTNSASNITTNEDQSTAITLLASDVDGDPLTYTLTNPSHGSLSGTAPNMTYAPTANYNGSDSFAFKVSDGIRETSNVSVSITVAAVNDAPTASSQSLEGGNTPQTISLSGSDADNDALTASLVTQPLYGSLGAISNNTVTYTPAAGYVGTDSFTFKMSDGSLSSSAATVSINIKSSKSGTVLMQIMETNHLNQLIGLADNPGNTHKLMDACEFVDDTGVLTIVGVGIQTPNIAVKQGDKVHYVDSDMDGFLYKNVRCGGHYIFISTVDEITRIDTNTLQVTGNLDFSAGDPIYYSNLKYDAVHQKLFVSFIGEEGGTPRVQMYDAQTLVLLKTFYITRSDMYVKTNGDIVAINTTGTNTVTVYDAATYAQKSSTTLSNSVLSGGTGYDVNRNKLWWYTQAQVKTASLDNLNGYNAITSITHNMPEVDYLSYSGDYLMIGCENCYDTRESNDVNTEQGGLAVINGSNNTLLYTMPLPYKHKAFMVDGEEKTGLICNNEADSAWRVDLATGGILENVDFGNGFEWSLMDKNGIIHLANRLGGSTLATYNPDTHAMTSIDVEEWPMGLAYDSNDDLLVTFNLFGNGFSFFDLDSSSRLSLNRFVDLTGVMNTPSTDSLGDVAYDSTHHVAAAAIPEYRQVVVMDANGNTRLIDLPYTGEVSKSAGIINLAINEANQYLFVYFRDAKKIYVYDGGNNYNQIGEITPVDGWGSTDYPYSMFKHENELYVGPYAYDMATFAQSGKMRYGYRVIGMDTDFNIVLLLGTEDEVEYLYAVSMDDQTLLGQVELDPVDVSTAHGVYNNETGMVYLTYTNDSKLLKIKVFE